ncbi:MAG: hypothetical protein COU22_02320 [Candidatus Komeilibacteria bacterium CG10_big_fil_rev_8_21_14_0_10_41_13]|uniref:Uncharacterized protein n=1 Tax=Candidatus Komeilibacteria bacterium CG10_big_fil_rev_8_21_14_0_10_41_13 TaxID=1974476 RepID=A0A2M6WC77_9BACT|nr:MAG: hypothetical protein COU22_02320 [Candidatus Komeilibacteria bacterium CG10_big_fil_rev_8_21_14_0_10_41_13]
MSLTQSIAKNTFWQVVGKIIGTFIGVVTIGLLTRYLGREGFGHYTTAMAFMQFFGVLLDMGLYLICLKEISAKPDQESYIYNNILTLRIITALLFLGGACLLIFAFPYPSIVKWSAVILSLTFFFMSLVQVITSLFQKYLRMDLVALAETLGRIGLLILTLLFVYWQIGLPWLMLTAVANTFIYFIIIALLAKKYLKTFSLAFDFDYWKIVLQKTWPIAVGIALNLVYFRADTIILSLYHSAEVVGLYGAPYKILEVIATFPHMFMGLITPLLTAAWISKNLEGFKNIMQRTFDFFIILIVPMILGAIPLAGGIMKLIAGDEFIASGQILPALILATGLIFLGTMFTYTLVVLDQQKAMLKFFLIAAVLSLIGYFVFIPTYAYFGAAWVTVIIEAFITFSALYLTYKFTKLRLNLKVIYKSLTAGLVMMLALYYLYSLPILLLIMLAVIIYGAIMWLIKGVDRKLINAIFKG